MPSGAEHYAEAERLVADAINPRTDSPYDDDATGGVSNTIAAAQVHATLAKAAATAMAESGAMPGADFDAWAAVAGTTPKAAA